MVYTSRFHPTWTVHEQIIPVSHPRDYRPRVRDPQTSRLRLYAQQCVPHHTEAPQENAITMTFQHGMHPSASKDSCESFFSYLI